MARIEPHAAYSAYTHGLKHRWNYVMRTIPGISPVLRPLEDAIRNTFLPVLLRSRTLGDNERTLLELSPRLSGLGITSTERMAATEHQNSIKLTRSLTEIIIAHDAHSEIDESVITELKKQISKDRQQEQEDSFKHLISILPVDAVRKFSLYRKQESLTS